MPSKKVHVLKQVEQTPDGQTQAEPVDEALENGPLAKRVCRDSLCCILFIVFLGGMIGIAGYSISKGNPNLIGRGYDNDGKMCGVDTGYEDYPYLYFPRPTKNYLTKTVCVKSCPADSSVTSLDCVATTEYPTCVKDESITATRPFYMYATKGYVSRICFPTEAASSVASDVSSNLFDSDILEQWISDIRETWPIIAGSIGIAFLVGFVYMIFLRYCSGVLTWAAILCFIGGMGVLGWRFYKDAQTLSEEMESTGGNTDGTNTEDTILTEKIVAYFCWGVAGFTFLAVLCLFNRIRLAIAIIKAAADFIKDTPSIFLLPPVMIIILVVFYVYWGGTAIFLVSSGDASQIKDTPFGTFKFDTTLKRLLIYHLFGLLWFNAFVLAACQFIVASATALWYFSQGTGQNAPKTIRTSISRFFRYHFGSIAFGSLILAIIQMIRLILAYMEQQAKKMAGKDGKLVRFALGCMQCYLACFERFIKFLNKNAYIQIALSGKSFCGAAKDAFSLIMRNPLRMGVVTSLGGVFVLFGKVFIGGLTALAGFLVITNWDKFSEDVYSPFIPTIVIFIFAYGIGAIFMTMYGLAADTILACFILDEEINKQKNAPPRHCPASLRDFLDKNAKK